MKDYVITTKDGLEFRMEEPEYKAMMADFRDNGQIVINENLITKADMPRFRAPEPKVPGQIAAEIFQPDTTDREEAIWKAEVLKYSQKRIFNKLKPFYSFWHYKAARMIAGSFEIADTIQVLETEDFETIDSNAKGFEQEHNENYRPKRPGCGKCDNGWILDHKKKISYPCECRPELVEEVRKYRMAKANLF